MPGRLLVICGVPGSGKSSIAKELASLDPAAAHIRTDSIRAMVPRPTFSDEESDRVYQAATEAAGRALDEGRLAILDGAFWKRGRRQKALADLAGRYSHLAVVMVECDLGTAFRRNASRDGVARVPEDRLAYICSHFDVPEDAVRVDSSSRSPAELAEEIGRLLLQPLVPPE